MFVEPFTVRQAYPLRQSAFRLQVRKQASVFFEIPSRTHVEPVGQAAFEVSHEIVQ